MTQPSISINPKKSVEPIMRAQGTEPSPAV